MKPEQEPLLIRFKNALPWATIGITRDMDVEEVVIKGALDAVSWTGFIVAVVGPIEWTTLGSYTFFMGKFFTYRRMKKYLQTHG